MALDPNRWTLKTQEAFNAAIESARTNANPEVTPDHLLVALLGQDEGVVLPDPGQGGQGALPAAQPRPKPRSSACPRPTAATPA